MTAPQGAPPAAEPPAPRLQIIADAGELVFRFPRAVDAAAWRRGGHLWLVFAPVPADLVLPTTVPAVVERVPHAEALIWRVRVPATAPRRIEGEGATWRVVEAPPQATAPSTAPEGTTPIALEDPWLGELWQVVPRPPGAGRTRASRPDGARLWLPTLHGARFRDLSARPRDPGDRRGHPGGLTAPLPRPELGPLFGLAAPSLPPAAAAERRRELETSLFADPVPARRLALARFLLGEAAPFDALAVLDAATAAPNDAAAAARLDALTGVAAVLAGRPDRAEPLLPPAAGADAAPERWLWRAMLAAAREDWGAAGEAFARSGQLWRDYPLPLRRLVALRAARAALALDAPQVALAVLHRVEPGAPAGGVTGRLALLHARALAAAGDLAAARAELDALTGDGVAPPIARHARLARVELDHAAGELDDAGARAALEPDVLGWTGRDDAARFWRFLAARRAATGDGRGAFEAWRRADADDVDDRRRAVLDALVAGEAPFADALADAVILLERRLELFAEGPARAERLRTLAGRVASETDALHVADRLYRRALAEPLPHALAVDLRVELAELRLERQLPHAAVAALQPLGGGLDPHVDALRRRAEALREGRPPPAPAPAEAAEAAAARAPADGGDAAETELRRVLETVDETLEETRRLLDDDAAAAPDGS